MRHVRGNHDAMVTETIAATGPFTVELPGVTLAVLDTVRPGTDRGRISTEQIEWLDDVAGSATTPVLVFGHHHPWDPASTDRNETYFGVNPDDSEALCAVIARREAIAGYFAGHTHRTRTRHFASARNVPIVEIACVKDYPGAWAEYRVYEGGYVQLTRRIDVPAAMAWPEKHPRHVTRALSRLHARLPTGSVVHAVLVARLVGCLPIHACDPKYSVRRTDGEIQFPEKRPGKEDCLNSRKS